MPLTVLENQIYEREILHSRFISLLSHMESEEDFSKRLKEIKERYPKAEHYCYGARFGNIEKMGDDGEPPHSAGLQILSSIRYKKLDNVGIIIVRYFGGTKLGLPRLTRAYRESAEEVISLSKIKESGLGLESTLSLTYSEFDSVKCVKAGFLKREEDISEYFFHGVSHLIGLDTHDPYFAPLDRSYKDIPLEPGMVISNEPGLYMEDRGIGIRIEDDLLITQKGADCLTADIIKNPDQIELFLSSRDKR